MHRRYTVYFHGLGKLLLLIGKLLPPAECHSSGRVSMVGCGVVWCVMLWCGIDISRKWIKANYFRCLCVRYKGTTYKKGGCIVREKNGAVCNSGCGRDVM